MWAINSHLASGEAGEWRVEGSGSLGLKASPAQGDGGFGGHRYQDKTLKTSREEPALLGVIR